MRNFIRQIILALPTWFRTHLLQLLLTIRVAGIVFAALALWIFAEIAEDVLEKESQSIDTAILLLLRSLHSPPLDQFMLGITFWGEPSVLLIICLLLGIWWLIKQQRAEATTLAIAGVGALGLNYLLKVLFGRARPALWERVLDVGQYSFPSGHAMISMVIYGMIGYFLVKRFPRWRVLTIIGTVLLITIIGLSRLYLGVHWPTDVLAGYAGGIVWLTTCIFSLEIWQERRSSDGFLEDESLSPEPSEQ